MSELKDCLHCGNAAEYRQEGGSIMAHCTDCGLRTPAVAAGLDYAARDRAAALWNAEAAVDWPQWQQPTGAHDAYPAGARTRHNGSRWISLMEDNVWEPGESGWREV